MSICFFVSDLHGKVERYNKLFSRILSEEPEAVFLGGDLLPSGLHSFLSDENIIEDFLYDFLIIKLKELKNLMKEAYPTICLILGNDDGKINENDFVKGDEQKLWHYIHNNNLDINEYKIFGYSYIPPTPFLLKDWERYDVSRYVDPGCISPEDGRYSVDVNTNDKKYKSIEKDLEALAGNFELNRSIFLFHSPPYQTNLDRADLEGKIVDHVAMDVNVGSIAIKRFIEMRQPSITLHGHVHESARLTGSWKDKIGSTYLFTAAHDGPELSLIKFDKYHPEDSTRELI